MGRVYSAAFEDGDGKAEPEWPPHPSRLFSALTAAWGEGGSEEELRPALEWLERQDPPRIHFGAHTKRRLVQAFVPVNDAETIPEDRPRKGRVFPSASLAAPDVYFIWETSPTEEIRAKLDQILLRTSSLGHSSSLVSIEFAQAIEADRLTEWHPGAPRGERMRIPYAGRLGDLVERHKRFQESGSKMYRPTAGRTALYASRQEIGAEPARGLFEQMIVLRRGAGQRASLRSTLSVTGALRRAILQHGPQPAPEYISGHAHGSTPEAPMPSASPHVAFIPLANIGFPYATGDLLGAAIVLPRTLTREQREICWRAVECVEKLTMPWGWWDVLIADAEEQRRALLPETWTKESVLWSTVTPFVFDRYPKDPYGVEAEQTVHEAFIRVGLPAPCQIDLHYNPWHVGVPKASAFPPAPARAGKPQRYHCHIRARFERPIAGPVLAGAGRFYGYGLFRQLAENGDRR
jgi:CRISPR-associated protein Csb2